MTESGRNITHYFKNKHNIVFVILLFYFDSFVVRFYSFILCTSCH